MGLRKKALDQWLENSFGFSVLGRAGSWSPLFKPWFLKSPASISFLHQSRSSPALGEAGNEAHCSFALCNLSSIKKKKKSFKMCRLEASLPPSWNRPWGLRVGQLQPGGRENGRRGSLGSPPHHHHQKKLVLLFRNPEVCWSLHNLWEKGRIFLNPQLFSLQPPEMSSHSRVLIILIISWSYLPLGLLIDNVRWISTFSSIKTHAYEPTKYRAEITHTQHF